MIRRRRIQFRRQSRATAVSQLIDMHPQFEPMLFRGLKNMPGLIDVEIAVLAKNIAIFRQFFACYPWQHLFDDL